MRSIAADSNVLLSAAAGRAARRVFIIAPELMVLTTEPNYQEVWKYLPRMAGKYGIELRKIQDALRLLPVEIVAEEHYRGELETAHGYLGQRDPDDVPLAALALSVQIPIWSNDKDFETLPVPVYPTAKLLRLLES